MRIGLLLLALVLSIVPAGCARREPSISILSTDTLRITPRTDLLIHRVDVVAAGDSTYVAWLTWHLNEETGIHDGMLWFASSHRIPMELASDLFVDMAMRIRGKQIDVCCITLGSMVRFTSTDGGNQWSYGRIAQSDSGSMFEAISISHVNGRDVMTLVTSCEEEDPQAAAPGIYVRDLSAMSASAVLVARLPQRDYFPQRPFLDFIGGRYRITTALRDSRPVDPQTRAQIGRILIAESDSIGGPWSNVTPAALQPEFTSSTQAAPLRGVGVDGVAVFWEEPCLVVGPTIGVARHVPWRGVSADIHVCPGIATTEIAGKPVIAWVDNGNQIDFADRLSILERLLTSTTLPNNDVMVQLLGSNERADSSRAIQLTKGKPIVTAMDLDASGPVAVVAAAMHPTTALRNGRKVTPYLVLYRLGLRDD